MKKMMLGEDGKGMKKGGIRTGRYEGKGELMIHHGGAKPDGRKVRAAIVKKVMADKGLSMVEASKYVKEHDLYKK
jgi:hypothetical protein